MDEQCHAQTHLTPHDERTCLCIYTKTIYHCHQYHCLVFATEKQVGSMFCTDFVDFMRVRHVVFGGPSYLWVGEFL